MITWSSLLIDDHCSSWSIVQLLGWLNHSRVAWLKTKRAWRFHLRGQAVLLPDAGADGNLPEHEELSGVARLLAEPRRRLPEAELRYCPACIGYGMHYAYQQDHRFRNCILHGLPLQERCPSCSNALETKGMSCNAYMCLQCGQSLLDASTPRLSTAGQADSAAAALDELEAWQWAADQLGTGYQTPCTGYAHPLWGNLSLGKKTGWYWRAIEVNPNPMVAAALEPAPSTFHFFPSAPKLISLWDHRTLWSAEFTAPAYQLMFRAVSRHLRRRHLRGHGACAGYALAAMGGLGGRIPREVYIHPDMCCMGQGYALWRLQWDREFKRMDSWLDRRHADDSEKQIGLPSLPAAQLCLVSSFQHWVYALAEIQNAYAGSDQRAILDGVTDTPHWALLQPGAAYSCPMHFRHPDLGALGRCDRGGVRRREHARVLSSLQEIGRQRQAFRAPLLAGPSQPPA